MNITKTHYIAQSLKLAILLLGLVLVTSCNKSVPIDGWVDVREDLPPPTLTYDKKNGCWLAISTRRIYIMSGDFDYFNGKEIVNIPSGICYSYKDGHFNRFLIFALMKIGYKYDPRFYSKEIIKAAAVQMESTSSPKLQIPAHLFGGSG